MPSSFRPRSSRPAALGALVVALAGLPAGGATGAATRTIVMEAVAFKPGVLTVHVGDTVVWRNQDPFPHTATSSGAFDSGPIAAGASWSYRAQQRGELAYVCTLHPNMKAVLRVE